MGMQRSCESLFSILVKIRIGIESEQFHLPSLSFLNHETVYNTALHKKDSLEGEANRFQDLKESR